MNKCRIRRFGILLGLLLCVLGGCTYVYLVYHGYVLLNNPSRRKYPVAGVDLSHYQGEVDWELLSQQAIDFAYIKATEGSSHVDSQFSQNWIQSHGTRLKTGAYHFFSFDSPGETQAENFIRHVESREGMLPPVIDVEYYADKKENPPDGSQVREQLQIMLDKLEEHYQKTPVIYCTEEIWEAYLAGHFEAYPLWIRSVFTRPGISEPWTFWQYTNRGRLPGYSGEEVFIDLNVFYGSREEWEQFIR